MTCLLIILAIVGLTFGMIMVSYSLAMSGGLEVTLYIDFSP